MCVLRDRLIGRTTDFDSVCVGSNPAPVTIYRWINYAHSYGKTHPKGEMKTQSGKYFSECRKVGNPLGLGPRDRRFKSCYSAYMVLLAQSEECRFVVPKVTGSIPVQPPKETSHGKTMRGDTLTNALKGGKGI